MVTEMFPSHFKCHVFLKKLTTLEVFIQERNLNR